MIKSSICVEAAEVVSSAQQGRRIFNGSDSFLTKQLDSLHNCKFCQAIISCCREETAVSSRADLYIIELYELRM